MSDPHIVFADLIESLRALGYSRLLPMDSFKKPNFPLLAEILEFLMARIEPELNLPPDLNNEHDRVYFVKMIAETMVNARSNKQLFSYSRSTSLE